MRRDKSLMARLTREVRLNEGESAPSKIYGLTTYDPLNREAVLHPVPLNLVVSKISEGYRRIRWGLFP